MTFGTDTRELPISAQFGEPGAYRSIFFPTAAGPYTFRIFGETDGQPIDESFTSGPLAGLVALGLTLARRRS
ncbi:hypothetical protein BH20CHL8_BH20CHL8_02190 [soil metagenome]